MQSNSFEFITQGGIVSISVALILAVMSILSWYFMLIKVKRVFEERKTVTAYIKQFWSKPTLHEALKEAYVKSPAYRLAVTAVESAQHHLQFAGQMQANAASQDEFIARQLRRKLNQEQAAMENGLTVLASVGSVATFVGLFGTVWGIFHALEAIGSSGSATIDKVAGPVGEALIMTAIGLAVAIPAVLAYNAFVKSNRKAMAQLEDFAQDLHTLLITGAPLVIKPHYMTSNVTNIQAAYKQNANGGE